MNPDLAASLGLLTLQTVVVAVIVLLLFRLRHRFGLGLLYIFVGSNQYLQTALSGITQGGPQWAPV